MAIENTKVLFSKRRLTIIIIMCEIQQRSPRRTLFFLISLHCFNIRKTSMNAAGPAFCCVSTTVQLVMYHP